MLTPDTAGPAAMLREAARKAAQRADEAGDDLRTAHASIEHAYAALDALFCLQGGAMIRQPHPATSSEVTTPAWIISDPPGELESAPAE